MNKKLFFISLISIILLGSVFLFLPNTTKETYAAGTTLADYVKSLGEGKTTWNAGNSGVYYTNNHDYRYIGPEVNNYVSFNNDLYRIIGVFDDYTHGIEGEYLVKLIRSRSIGSYSWGAYNSNNTGGTYQGYANDWVGTMGTATTKANLNILLNEYFYKKTNTSTTYDLCSEWTYYNTNYRTNSCSDIVGYGIKSNLQNYIENATWHLRGYTGNDLTASGFYECERGGNSSCTGANGSTTNVETEAKIGLMYVSDYMYASSAYASTTTTTQGSSSYNGENNWLYKGYEWTIMPNSNNASSSFHINYNGNVNTVSAYTGYGHGVRPTFYLKSSVYMTGEGTGTFDNPFTIACDDCTE